MNNRYIRIIITCLLVGVITIATKKRKASAQTKSTTHTSCSHSTITDEIHTAQKNNTSVKKNRNRKKTQNPMTQIDTVTIPESVIETADVPAATEETSNLTVIEDNNSEQIILNPHITKKSLSYQYGFVSYSPQKFSVSCNGSSIDYSAQNEVAIEIPKERTLNFKYEWDFGYGYKGERETIITIPENTKKCTLTFDWSLEDKIGIKTIE